MKGERHGPENDPSSILTVPPGTVDETAAIPEQALVTGDKPLSEAAEQPKSEDMMSLILKFLEVPGQVLLIDGAPGTGKTSLALEILNRMENTHKVYASSRVSPAKLRQHFPWLDEVIDSMSGRTARSTWMDELHDIRATDPDNVLNKVLRLKHSRRKAVLVVDSWEGALRNTKEEGRHMLESAMLSELDESRVSIVIVTESEKHGNLDYLVDGIVTLVQSELEGRKTRLLELKKLRGFKVPSMRRIFTLDQGRFNLLSPGPLNGSYPESTLLVPIAHKEKSYSTGIPDLDRAFGGGVQRGAFLLIDMDSNVPPLWMRMLLNIVRANFVNQGGGCFILPTGGYSSDNVAESLRPLVGEAAMDERVRIIDYSPNLPSKKWRVPLSGQLMEDVRTFTKTWGPLARNTAGTMLNLNLDKIVQVYGEDLALPGFTEIGEGMRDARAFLISVSSLHSKVRDDTLRNADYHLKVQNLGDSCLICGVKPFTPLYAAKFDLDKGYPAMNLTAVV